MYGIMLAIILKKRRRVGWFLCISSGIILSSLVSYSPSIIVNIWNVPISYEVAQMVTITLYYINGILNPFIYFVAHPMTRNQVRNLTVVLKIRRKVDVTAPDPTIQNSRVSFSRMRNNIHIPMTRESRAAGPMNSYERNGRRRIWD